MFKLIKKLFFGASEEKKEDVVFRAWFKQIGVGTQRVMQVATFIFHESKADSELHMQYRATVAILLRNDGYIFPGVSVCSVADNWEYAKGRRNAIKRATRRAFLNQPHFKNPIDIHRMGNVVVKDGELVCEMVDKNEIIAFQGMLKGVVDDVRHQAIDQVLLNRTIIRGGFRHEHKDVVKLTEALLTIGPLGAETRRSI